MSESEAGLCPECFPEPAEVARLAENAQAGRSEAFVGTGDPATVLACPHSETVLGDVVASLDEDESEALPGCSETTAAGEPCKNAPGDDGLCGVHRKQKEASDGSAEPVDQDADQAAEAEEDDR